MNRQKIKNAVLTACLMFLSIGLSILAAEAMSRLVLDPVDYLNPTLEPDEFLNHRIHGYTGGHDEWGFRNSVRPKSADIVCIGDSLTYGVSAQASQSWPAVLGNLRNETVYNMGLGGYGPIQYLHLMRTLAVKLHPKTVIIGFYFGNDLLDVYNVARFNANWREYAKFDHTDLDGPAFVFPRKPGKFLGGLRDWLSRTSVLYALVTQLPTFQFIRKSEAIQKAGDEADSLIPYRDAKHDVIFNLSPRSRFLDMRDPRIERAMEITRRVFADMRQSSADNSIRLVVALLPTKERVYSNLLRNAGYTAKYPSLARAIDDEDLARTKILGYLSELKIETIDLLPPLEAQVETRDLFPLTDSHPNKDGYFVIASEINGYLTASH